MDASLQPLLVSLDLKGMVLENSVMCKSSIGSLWSRVLKAQAMRRRHERKDRIKRTNGGQRWSGRPKSILMKRRPIHICSRRPMNGMGRRVRALKKLIPNGNSTGLDGLFKETTDYILSLQMQVKVMQIMVKVFQGSKE